MALVSLINSFSSISKKLKNSVKVGTEPYPAPSIPISSLSIKVIFKSGDILLTYKAVNQPAVPPPTITVFLDVNTNYFKIKPFY